MFVVSIRNAKNVQKIKFHSDAPMLKYYQSTSKICCFSGLAPYFDIINQIKAANKISKRIEQ